MSKEDVSEVVKIGLCTKQLQVDDEKDMYYEPKTLLKAIESPSEICLVAKDGDTIAGFFLAHLNLVFSEVYISDVALKPEYRGQGVGTMLMDEARIILKRKNIDWSWALAQQENTAMHKFMEKQGFIRGKLFYFFYKPSGF